MKTPVNLPRFSKGKRPHFFASPDADHMLAMILELTTELSVAYDRIDRLEAFLATSGVIDREALAAFERSPEEMRDHEQWSSLLLDRMFSSVEHPTQAPD